MFTADNFFSSFFLSIYKLEFMCYGSWISMEENCIINYQTFFGVPVSVVIFVISFTASHSAKKFFVIQLARVSLNC
jgi:hypothetical protein